MNRQDAIATSKAIWRHLNAVGGYQPYGWDWPTLRMLYPQIARQLKACYIVIGGAA